MTVGHVLVLSAIPIGILFGIGAVMENEIEERKNRFGWYFLVSLLAATALSYLVSLDTECSIDEVLLLTEYCGYTSWGRFHYAFHPLVVLFVCALVVSWFRRS